MYYALWHEIDVFSGTTASVFIILLTLKYLFVPLGTAIVRIWGAEPGLASVREDATRKSVAE